MSCHNTRKLAFYDVRGWGGNAVGLAGTGSELCSAYCTTRTCPKTLFGGCLQNSRSTRRAFTIYGRTQCSPVRLPDSPHGLRNLQALVSLKRPGAVMHSHLHRRKLLEERASLGGPRHRQVNGTKHREH